MPTERLKTLFAGVPSVMLVDDSYSCLRGEDIRNLLEACGALRYVRPIEDSSLSRDERGKLREQTGHAETSNRNDRITDWKLDHLDSLLGTLPTISTDERAVKAKLLWEELAHLEERRGKGIFTGEYTWTHYGDHRAPPFEAAFIRLLKKTAWISDATGELQCPELVLFDSLGWRPNPFLQSMIRFKPPIIETLAKEAGIEPGILDLLKRLSV